MRRGILMVLANVGPEDEVEFNRWYDCEHMRERVEIPGFLSAQRYISAGDSPWKYLALYETESLQTLRSPVYQQALASQSGWSKSVLARFRDPQRCVAERACREGCGTGAVVSLTRLRANPGRAEDLRIALSSKILPEAQKQDGVIGASLMESDPVLSRPVAEYPKGGLDLIRPDDWFVAVNAITAEQARFQIAEPVRTDLVDAFEPIGTFELLWDLHRSDLGPVS